MPSSPEVERHPRLGVGQNGSGWGSPHPCPEPRGTRSGGDSAVGRPQTPGESVETGGRGAGVSTRGKTRSAEAQAEPRAPKTGCRVVVPHPATPRACALGRGRGGQRTWGSLRPLFSPERATAWAEGPHPGLRSCCGPGDRRVDRLVGALWCFCYPALLLEL